METIKDFFYRLKSNQLNDLEGGGFGIVFGLCIFLFSYWIYNSYRKEGYRFKPQKRDTFVEYLLDANRVRTYYGSIWGMVMSIMVIIAGIIYIILYFKK